MIRRCTNFGGAVVSVLRADTELPERCRTLKQQSTAVMIFSLALVWRCWCETRIWLYIRREIAQKPILNQASVECRPHLHRMCTALRYNCISIYADIFDMIGALVQQQNQNLLRLQKAIKNRSELLSKRSVQLRSQKRYAAKLTLNPRRVNPDCTESRSINARFPLYI